MNLSNQFKCWSRRFFSFLVSVSLYIEITPQWTFSMGGHTESRHIFQKCSSRLQSKRESVSRDVKGERYLSVGGFCNPRTIRQECWKSFDTSRHTRPNDTITKLKWSQFAWFNFLVELAKLSNCRSWVLQQSSCFSCLI